MNNHTSFIGVKNSTGLVSANSQALPLNPTNVSEGALPQWQDSQACVRPGCTKCPHNSTSYPPGRLANLHLCSTLAPLLSCLHWFHSAECTQATPSPNTHTHPCRVKSQGCMEWGWGNSWKWVVSPIRDISITKSWNRAGVQGAGCRGLSEFEGCHGCAKC